MVSWPDMRQTDPADGWLVTSLAAGVVGHSLCKHPRRSEPQRREGNALAGMSIAKQGSLPPAGVLVARQCCGVRSATGRRTSPLGGHELKAGAVGHMFDQKGR